MNDSVAILVAAFRWTSWSPSVFYTQLLLSAFICLSESPGVSCLIWRAFIVGRVRILSIVCLSKRQSNPYMQLPRLLALFEQVLTEPSTDWASYPKHSCNDVLKGLSLAERNANCVRVCFSTRATHTTL